MTTKGPLVITAECIDRQNNALDKSSDLEKVLNQPAVFSNRNPEQQLPGVMLGKIVSTGSNGLQVELPSLSQQPLPAMALCVVSEQALGRTCVVQFADGDMNKPIVMGLLVEPEQVTVTSPELAEGIKQLVITQLVITQQNDQVIIDAKKELILRCGESKIILTADGVIHIRGLYINSQAKATQRLRGSSVRIN